MKRDNFNYLVTGIFVVVSFVALLVVLSMITGRTGPTDSYYIQYKNVTGIKFGTPVFFEGFLVGQVEHIDRSGDGASYKVDLSVKEGWKIPEDSVASMISSGLLSGIVVDISEGESSTNLQPGSAISGREGGNLFLVLNDVAAEIQDLSSNSIKPLLNNLNKRIDGMTASLEEGAPIIISDLKELTSKLNKGADSLNRILSGHNEAKINNFVKNMSDVSDKIALMTRDLHETRQIITDTFGEINKLVEDNKDNVSESFVKLRSSLDVVSRHVDSISYNLESASRNINEFTNEIRKNPGALLNSSPPQERTR